MRLRRALAPPIVRAVPRTDIRRPRGYAWLRQYGAEYKGRWVAVGEDGLLASAPTLAELQAQLRALTPAYPPLIHKL